jgi:hypothetical protein
MARELVRVTAKINKTILEFNGAKWFYNDGDIRSHAGLQLKNERQLDDGDVIVRGKQAKQKLVQLQAILRRNSLVGNAAQNDNKEYRYKFYCDPDSAEQAMLKLPGKIIDNSLLPGNWKIDEVTRPLRVSYS